MQFWEFDIIWCLLLVCERGCFWLCLPVLHQSVGCLITGVTYCIEIVCVASMWLSRDMATVIFWMTGDGKVSSCVTCRTSVACACTHTPHHSLPPPQSVVLSTSARQTPPMTGCCTVATCRVSWPPGMAPTSRATQSSSSTSQHLQTCPCQ